MPDAFVKIPYEDSETARATAQQASGGCGVVLILLALAFDAAIVWYYATQSTQTGAMRWIEPAIAIGISVPFLLIFNGMRAGSGEAPAPPFELRVDRHPLVLGGRHELELKSLQVGTLERAKVSLVCAETDSEASHAKRVDRLRKANKRAAVPDRTQERHRLAVLEAPSVEGHAPLRASFELPTDPLAASFGREDWTGREDQRTIAWHFAVEGVVRGAEARLLQPVRVVKEKP